MKSNILNNLVNEILSEMFINCVDLKQIPFSSNISILFQDNNIKIEKVEEKKSGKEYVPNILFKVKDVSNDGKIKVNDVLLFLDSSIRVGTNPQCFIFRRNESGKLKKINTIHEFSFIKSIQTI
jgi:hypothetical protein